MNLRSNSVHACVARACVGGSCVRGCVRGSWVTHACIRACVAREWLMRAPCSVLRTPCSVLRAPYSVRASCVASCCVASCCVALVGPNGSWWELMGTCGNLWELMGTCGNLWELVGTYGNLRDLVGTYGNLWESSCMFLRCKVFFQCVFSMQVVFTLCVFTARRFYIACFRCKAFFRCVFYTAGRFFVVYFTLQGVFSLCILCVDTFYCHIFLHFLSQYIHFLSHNIRVFVEPQHVYHPAKIRLIIYYYTCWYYLLGVVHSDYMSCYSYHPSMLTNYMKTQKTNNKLNSIFIIFYSKQQFLFETVIGWVLIVIVPLLAFMRFESGFFRKRS